MYDTVNLIKRLEDILETLGHIQRRSAGVESADFFEQSDVGRDRLDAICMSLIAVGEAFKQIDRKTDSNFLSRYPKVDWRGVIGVRDVIAHGYFDISFSGFPLARHRLISSLSVFVRRLYFSFRIRMILAPHSLH